MLIPQTFTTVVGIARYRYAIRLIIIIVRCLLPSNGYIIIKIGYKLTNFIYHLLSLKTFIKFMKVKWDSEIIDATLFKNAKKNVE